MQLENLFKFTSKLPIMDEHGTQVKINKKPLFVYQRIIGDADLTRARKAALHASKVLRQELKSSTEDDIRVYLPDYDDLDKASIISMIILAESLELRRQANNSAMKPKEPTRPGDDATLEEQENYEAAKLEWPQKVEAAITEQLDKIIAARRKELETWSDTDLTTLLIRGTIDNLCRTTMLQTFNTWCAYLGTYSDKAMTKRAFDSYESFDNAAPLLKDQLVAGYIKLDISGEDLKN